MTRAAPAMLLSLDGAPRFQAAMAVRPCARTAHFFAHHVAHPVLPGRPTASAAPGLSTGDAASANAPVDERALEAVESLLSMAAVPAVAHLSLGLVIPKRHAKRSVTRNLVRRQVREAVRVGSARLVPGDWVIRLRAPLDRAAFPSASSDALAAALRAEVAQLLSDAARRTARAATP